VLLTIFALKTAHAKGTISNERYQQLIHELVEVPEKVATILKSAEHVKFVAENIRTPETSILADATFFPIALEGALKLKEISYIHAEGYPAAEMKHGPIALVEETLPVVFVATRDSYHEKIVSNIQEIKARKGMVIAIISVGDEVISQMADDTMVVPEADELVAPMLSVIPLQLFAYHLGIARGCDVDKPRNLAKSVTVE
jgi:glucosamine--fructose-6-phosphate aminotransferase (isomerizing)